jgi:hypothetical protein
MRTDLKSRLGRATAAIVVGVATLVGVASTADAQDWRYHNWRYHHWNRGNSWALSHGYYDNGYYPYYNRSWNRGWTWGERYGAPPYAYYSAPRYYAPPAYSYGLVIR